MPKIGETGPLGSFLAEVSSWGHLGVVVFNILSGYVLSLSYLENPKTPTPRYMEFLRRRFLRILPNYWISLLFWSLILLISSNSLASLVWPFLAHLFFLHSFFSELFFSIVPAYWWLGLLAQFYLTFPILLKVFRRWGALKCAVMISLGCWTGWIFLHAAASSQPSGTLASLDYLLYFNLPARLPEFTAGMWLAFVRLGSPKLQELTICSSVLSTYFSRRFLVLTGLTLVLLGFLVNRNQLPLYHAYLFLWCFLLVSWILASSAAGHLGRIATVVGLAKISYSVYLLHQPVLTYSALFMEKIGLGNHFWPFFLVGTACVTAALSMGLERLLSELRARAA